MVDIISGPVFETEVVPEVSYSELIFGSVRAVQELLVAALKKIRLSKKYTQDKFDRVAGLVGEFADTDHITCRQYEADPSKLNWRTLEQLGIHLGFCVDVVLDNDKKITNFLKQQENKTAIRKRIEAEGFGCLTPVTDEHSAYMFVFVNIIEDLQPKEAISA